MEVAWVPPLPEKLRHEFVLSLVNRAYQPLMSKDTEAEVEIWPVPQVTDTISLN